MITSGAFDYIDILNKAADASWTREQVLQNNLANVDTPNYKRKDVNFNTYMTAALSTGVGSLDSKISNLVKSGLSSLNATVYTDNSSLSYRSDGNNVSAETENVYLAENQINYNTLIEQMSQEFSRLKAVLS